MLSLNTLIVVFAILCCSSQVRSVPTVQSKYYVFKHKLLRGNYFFGQKSLLFTLCSSNYDQDAIRCRMSFESNVFDITHPPLVCIINITTLQQNAHFLDILGVTLWGEDKGILAWREQSNSNSQELWVHLKTVFLTTCNTTVNTVAATDRLNWRQVFITPYADSYEVSFNNEILSPNKFCMVTVNAHGVASNPVGWFPNTDSIWYLAPVGDKSSGRKLVVTTADNPNTGVRVSLAYRNKITKLMEVRRFRDIVWSTSNDFISLCSLEKCMQFNKKGKLRKEIDLNNVHQPHEFLALYTLANKDLLAVICENRNLVNNENDYYRIIKIDADGRQWRSINLIDLNCSNRPNYVYMQFFENSSTEYCLTLFHFTNYPLPHKRSQFSRVCFASQDFLI